MSAAHAHPPYAHRRSLNAHRWSKAQAGRAYLRLVVLSVGKRVVAQHGRLGDAPAVRCDSGRAASPKPCHDVRRVAHQALRSLRHCLGNTCCHGPTAPCRRRRTGGTGRRACPRRESCLHRAGSASQRRRRAGQLAPGRRAALAVLLLVGLVGRSSCAGGFSRAARRGLPAARPGSGTSAAA